MDLSCQNNTEKQILCLLAREHNPKKYSVFDSLKAAEAGQLELFRVQDVESAKQIVERCYEQEVRICTVFHSSYPVGLRHIANAPAVVFFRGEDLSRLGGRKCLAVVGSRRADASGRKVAGELSRAVADCGGVIVSGLACGIDAAAHAGALSVVSDISTVAILGHGLFRPVYPASNRKLADQIVDSGGLLMSQFLPDVPPYPSNFLNRNRVIAGMSEATLIVQATARSGSLSTARHARDEGREVFVCPGPFDSGLYEGSHELIRQGAVLIHNASQLLRELDFEQQSPLPDKTQDGMLIDARFRKLYEAFLESRHLPYEQLQNIVSDEPLLQNCLLELELGGYIQRLPGRQYVRKG